MEMEKYIGFGYYEWMIKKNGDGKNGKRQKKKRIKNKGRKTSKNWKEWRVVSTEI